MAQNEVFVEATRFAVTSGRGLDDKPASHDPVNVVRISDDGGIQLGTERWAVNVEQWEFGVVGQYWLTKNGQWVRRNAELYPEHGSRAWKASFRRWARECLYTRDEAIDAARSWLAENGEPRATYGLLSPRRSMQ